MEPRLSGAANYAATLPFTRPEPNASLGATARSLTEDFAATLETAEQLAQQTLMGSGDPQAMVQALVQAQLAVETAVVVRDKVVQAYQEILRMPI